MSRILAVDDEPAIRRLLKAIIERGGFNVVLASDAKAALAELTKGQIDTVILDLGLPDRDGIEVIAAIRAISNCPILVLTARTGVAEKIAALDLGADDFVTKPFDGDELLARLRSVLRRTQITDATPSVVTHQAITMDTGRHQVSLKGQPVSLTPKEFALLLALVKAAGRIVTHGQLLEEIWGKAHVDDVDYLRVTIRSLRLKIEEDPSAPDQILNEPGIGYRLAG